MDARVRVVHTAAIKNWLHLDQSPHTFSIARSRSRRTLLLGTAWRTRMFKKYMHLAKCVKRGAPVIILDMHSIISLILIICDCFCYHHGEYHSYSAPCRVFFVKYDIDSLHISAVFQTLLRFFCLI